MNDKPALSFPVIVQHVPQKGLTVTIKTDEHERDALARDHDLVAVRSFSAEFLLTPWKKDGIKLRGRVNAVIVQSCIVTLEPLESEISENVEAIFVPENSRLARMPTDASGELLIDADGPDIPEIFEGDRIDVGQVAEEFFDLAIDPYPRKPGVEDIQTPLASDDIEEEEKPVSPFAKLSDWQKKS